MKLKISAAAAALLATLGASQARDIEMQSIYPGTLPLVGQSGVEFGARVSLIAGDSLNITFRNPGEIVGGNEIWDAVSTGAIEAAWYSPGFAEGVIPAAALFTAFPFGPDVREYTAWWYYGGGAELWAELAEPFSIHTELCAITAPEASGWFREEINSVEDLQGKKMRLFGLAAAVMQKLGVEAQFLTPADTMTALNLGTIDAAELAFPAIDDALGMYEHASHYYFPGWHQQTSLIVFIMNTDSWNGLDERQRATIREVCTANVALTTAEGEAIQLAPLARMVNEEGVQTHRWSDEMLAAFEGAWQDVVDEKSDADADFKRVWDHIQAFRDSYSQWKALGYLD
ncbi:MAG: TRAP transporter substrate-binding protein [Roseitalea sp.]|jgi:TRAP-type mannitol/chloroaromatic compound transport system substrate-binding protein|nr:TRAP transporter substrate-binding protein [Roseitalea sp.]MBO6723178.1 TRAP transporter substrate-binding protein [Roseitalea sp.]MBO6745249.1 TRAP transporter substrate-binding protein [Roseitalea sp.]